MRDITKITKLLTDIKDEDLVPIESVLVCTIADKYRELGSVPIEVLNKLIDKERECRDLPKILWDDSARKQAMFEADILEIRSKGSDYAD
jgi:hypothetical protein